MRPYQRAGVAPLVWDRPGPLRAGLSWASVIPPFWLLHGIPFSTFMTLLVLIHVLLILFILMTRTFSLH